MSWPILISISVLLFALTTVLQRLLLKTEEIRPIAYAIFFSTLTGLILIFPSFLSREYFLPQSWPSVGPNLLLSIILYALASIFIYSSLKVTQASVFSIIFSSRALFTVAFSSLLLKEFLNSGQLLGGVLIVTGIILANWESTKIKFGRGEFLALLGAVCFGLANVNDRYLLKFLNVYTILILEFLGPALLLSIIYIRELKYFKIFLKRDNLLKITVLSLTYAASSVTFFTALKLSGNVSKIATINLSGVVIAVILSIIILKERDNLFKKILAALLTFAGLLFFR